MFFLLFYQEGEHESFWVFWLKSYTSGCSFSFWVLYLCPWEAAVCNELEHSKANKTRTLHYQHIYEVRVDCGLDQLPVFLLELWYFPLIIFIVLLNFYKIKHLVTYLLVWLMRNVDCIVLLSLKDFLPIFQVQSRN